MNKPPIKKQCILLMLELSLLSHYCTFPHRFRHPSMLITTCVQFDEITNISFGLPFDQNMGGCSFSVIDITGLPTGQSRQLLWWTPGVLKAPGSLCVNHGCRHTEWLYGWQCRSVGCLVGPPLWSWYFAQTFMIAIRGITMTLVIPWLFS